MKRAGFGNALGAYFEAHGGYPEDDPEGKLVACGCQKPPLSCDWTLDEGQREFCDEENIVYIGKIPGDPTNGSSYRLYAKLENGRDPEASLKSECAGKIYNFGVSSSNTKP